jgi:hypothetical protein
MEPIPVSRYAPGGDIYQALAKDYGTAGAEKVYNAALSGDRGAITDAIVSVKHGQPLNDSTAEIFLQQIISDPLAAPIESLNNQVGNVFKNLLLNPFALVALGVVGVIVADSIFKLGLMRKLLAKIG